MLSKITLLASFSLAIVIFSPVFVTQQSARAQVESPNRKYLFIEDEYKKDKRRRAQEKKERDQRKKQSALNLAGEVPFNIDSPSINFDPETNTISAEGGVTVTAGSNVFEAESGRVNVESKDALLSGNVKFSDPTGSILADVAELNLNTVTGTLREADIQFEGEGVGYHVQAKEVEKLSGQVFDFRDASLTTCQCPESGDCAPWSLQAKEVNITRDGYGFAKGAILRVRDVPVFYTPYLMFPAKSDRQTGLLPMTFGLGKEDGYEIEVPFFWAIDESTDLTLTPIIETSTRLGADLEFRKIFSRNNEIQFGGVYFDESARDGDLQGTDTTDLHDPSLDVNRFAGYVNHTWRPETDLLPLQVIVDGNFVSDDLFLREFENDKIAPFNSRYVTSRGLVRTGFGSFSADLAVEYNQAMVTDDDVVFQRLPELTIDGINRFRPFGDNSLGAKLIVSSNLQAVNFQRLEGFDGFRLNANERFKIPFHFKNYFDAKLSAGITGTLYKIDDNQIADPTAGIEEFEDTSNRLIPDFSTEISTVVERIFDVPDDSFLKKVTELGTFGRRRKLVRMKHSLKPFLNYRFVPFVGQEDNPQFDSGDRLAERSFVTYGLVQRLFARFNPRNEYLYGIEEATPEVEDLESLRVSSPREDTFGTDLLGSSLTSDVSIRRADIQELATLKLVQSFDILEDRKDIEPEGSSLSDLGLDLALYPNGYVGFEVGSDVNLEDQELSAYSVATQLLDKRGDKIRLRLNFLDEQVRQLESSVELRMTDNLKLGYYARYDDLEAEFIENRIGMRFSSSCKCWLFDMLLTDRLNPDETKVLFTVTLVGLGELSNSLFTRRTEDS